MKICRIGWRTAGGGEAGANKRRIRWRRAEGGVARVNICSTGEKELEEEQKEWIYARPFEEVQEEAWQEWILYMQDLDEEEQEKEKQA